MAVEIEVRSNSKQARADLNQLNRAVENISATTDKVSKQFDNLVKASAAAFAVIGSAKAITRVTDSYRRLEARIALTTDSLQEQRNAFIRLNKIAIETRSNQESLADLYSRIGRATRKLGVDQATVIQVTENIAKAITISGSSAESANAAIVQLGQGLAAGALRGQELNSVLEQTPGVAQAIARGLGKDIGQLRAFANEGKLSAEVVINALKDQSAAVDAEFRKINPTFEQAFTVFSTGLGRVVNELDNLTGFSNSIVEALLNLGTKLNNVAVPLRNFIEGLSQGGLFGQVFFSTLRSLGLVVQSLGILFAEAFNRLIPLEFLLGIQSLRGALVSFFLVGTSDVIRVLNILDIALFDLSKRIDVFTASIARSPVAKLFRGVAVSIASAAADTRIATTVLIESVLILESLIVTRIAKIGISAQRFIGVFTNTIVRTTTELENFDDAVSATFSNFTGSISQAIDSLSRLEALGELTRILVDVVQEAIKSGSSLKELKDAVIGLSDALESSFGPSLEKLRGEISSAFDTIVTDVKGKSKEIISTVKDTLSGKSDLDSSFGDQFVNSIFRSLGVNRDVTKDFKKLQNGISKFADIVSTNLRKSYSAIRTFTNDVISFFEKIYMKVIGNSYWTDTMEGVYNLAEVNLRKTKRALKEFKEDVLSAFSDIQVAGVALGQILGGVLSFAIVQTAITGLTRINPILGAIFSAASLAVLAIKLLGFTIEDVEGKLSSVSNKTAEFAQNFNLLTTPGRILQNVKAGLNEIGALDSLIDTAKLIRAVFQPIGSALNSVFGDAIAAALVLAITNAKFGIVGVGLSIASLLGVSIIDTLDEVLQGFGTSTVAITESTFSKLGTVLGTTIIEAIKQLPSFLFAVGTSFVEGLLTSIPVIGDIANALLGAVNVVLAGIPAIATGGLLLSLLFGPKGSLGFNNIVTQSLGTISLVQNTIRALAGLPIVGSAGAIGTILFGKTGTGGLIARLTSLVPFLQTYFAGAFNIVAKAFSAESLNALFLPLQATIISVFGGLFTQLKAIAIAFTQGQSLTDLFTSSTIGSPTQLKASLATFFAGLRGADRAAEATDRKARTRAGRRGIFGKVLFGLGGLAALFTSTSAFASDVEGVSSGLLSSLLQYADIGLIAASLFGIGGISAAVGYVSAGIAAVLAPVLTGLTTVLLHPVFLTIAAIVAAVAAVGAIGVALFGAGNTFFEKLDDANIRILNQFGLIDSWVSGYSRESALEKALVGDFDPKSFSGAISRDINIRSPKDLINTQDLNVNALSGDDFQELLASSLELKKAIFEVRDLESRAYVTARDSLRAQNDVVAATLKTNALIENARKAAVETGRQIIKVGATEETAIGTADTTIFTSIVRPFAQLGDTITRFISFGGLEAGLTRAVDERNRNQQSQEGRSSEDEVETLNKALEDLRKFEQQFGRSVGENFAKEIGDIETELNNLRDFDFFSGLFNDDEIQAGTDKLKERLRQALADAQDNLVLFGGAEKIKKIAESFGIELNKNALLFASPGQRSEALALINQYEIAVRNFENSTSANIAGNAAAVKALEVALKTSLGSRGTATNTLLEGAGLNALSDNEFSRFSEGSFAKVVSGYGSIAKLENELVALNGANFEEEQRIRQEIEAQRLALRQVINDTITFTELISSINLSDFQQINLGTEDFSTVLTAQSKINDLRLEQDSLAKNDIANYQRIERLIRTQEEKIQRILNSTRSLSEIISDSGLSELGATRVDSTNLSKLEAATLRITELRQEQVKLGDETLAQYQENIALIREQEEIINRILDGTASVGDLLGKFSDVTNILGDADISRLITDNIKLVRLRREQSELGKEDVERYREIDTEIDRIVNGQTRLNDSISRGVQFAEDLRSTFQSTVEGIFQGTNDIGDIFDNVLKQISASAIESTAQSITDIVFGQDNTQLENYFGKLFKSADEEGTNWLTRIAKGAQDIITPVFDGIFGEGALGEFGGFINDIFGGIFGGSEEAPDGSSSSPFSVRLVEGLEDIGGSISDTLNDVLPGVNEEVGEGGKVLDKIKEKLGLGEEGEGFFTKVFTGFKDLVSNAGSILTSGFSSIVGSVGSLLTTGFQGIVSGIGGLFSSIGGLFSGGGSGGGIFSSILSGVTSFFTGGFSGVFDTITGLFTGGSGEGGGLLSSILGAFGGGSGGGGALSLLGGGGGLIGGLLGGLDKRGENADGTKNNPYYVIPVQEESVLSNLLGGGPLAGLVEGFLGNGPSDTLFGGAFSALTATGQGGAMGECPCGESNQLLEKSIGGLAPSLDGVFQKGVDGFGGVFSQLPQLLSGLLGGGGGGGSFLSTAIGFVTGFFNDGGIVPGGGPTPVMAHGGEMILNQRQQANLFNTMDKSSGTGANQQNISINVNGDISRQTKKEIFTMLPQIATGVNQYNTEKGN